MRIQACQRLGECSRLREQHNRGPEVKNFAVSPRYQKMAIGVGVPTEIRGSKEEAREVGRGLVPPGGIWAGS